jgi:hypothetical protein
MRLVTKAVLRIGDINVTGKNHAECISKFKERFTQEFEVKNGSIHYFVDRKEALKIAKEAGQIVNKHDPKDQLFSEDMIWSEKKRRFLMGQEIVEKLKD